MNYKLDANNGEVQVIRKAGSSFVKYAISEGQAKGYIGTAKSVEKSERFKGFEIAINGDELYLAGEFLAGEQEKPEEKPVKTQVVSDARRDFARREDHGKKKKH